MTLDFEQLFDSCSNLLFRLEARQIYNVPDELEAQEKYAAGETPPRVTEWSRFVHEAVDRGCTVERLRIVREPPSAYIKFELEWGYRPGIGAGEQIYISLDTRGHPDFWLFDESAVAFMHYSPDGNFIKAEISEDPQKVEAASRLRRELMGAAIPHSVYLARRRLSLEWAHLPLRE